MKRLTLILLIALILLGGYFLVKNNSFKHTSKGTLQVAASFYPMYFFASQIAGNRADVFNITPASAEPHDYEPTTQDLAKIQNSDILVLNGGKLEPWGDKVISNLQGTKTVIVVAGEGLANKTLLENGQTITDPHIWLDPTLAKQQIAKITQAFIKVDPKDATYFSNNQQKLDSALDVLDSNYKASLASCQKKDIVTSHAAFGYLSARYGLNQVAISGISPDAEPSAKELSDLANFVKKNNIDIIFFESLVSPKLSQTLAQETGAKTLVLDPIEGISDDNLKAGQNYLTVMQNNLTNLQIALQCNK